MSHIGREIEIRKGSVHFQNVLSSLDSWCGDVEYIKDLSW